MVKGKAVAAPNLQVIAALEKADLRAIKEREFQRALWQYAESHGWKCHYMYRSAQKLADGSYRGMGTAGWPDVIAVRGPEMLAIECKTEKGAVRPEQQEWLTALAEVEGIDTYLWRPRDAAEILERLK